MKPIFLTILIFLIFQNVQAQNLNMLNDDTYLNHCTGYIHQVKCLDKKPTYSIYLYVTKEDENGKIDTNFILYLDAKYMSTFNLKNLKSIRPQAYNKFKIYQDTLKKLILSNPEYNFDSIDMTIPYAGGLIYKLIKVCLTDGQFYLLNKKSFKREEKLYELNVFQNDDSTQTKLNLIRENPKNLNLRFINTYFLSLTGEIIYNYSHATSITPMFR